LRPAADDALIARPQDREVSMSEAIILEGATVAAVAAVSFALGWYAANRRRGQSRR
jgi:hypothetical protein